MTIVVGYVPTPEGEAALTAAISEARHRKEIVHVINRARSGDVTTDSRYASESDLDKIRALLDQSGVPYEIEQLVRGPEASEELVDAADRLGASMIVIGLRRRSPTGKLLFGSQAQQILLDANCPVLAVKAS
ncbi:universal stress protein [Blastococcus sp. CT_GayMR16]|uniref:universal stress protein n=1 Tax=Blastococcus sp. CT_GayMR16 TaxID=2559607 RepID=UPI001072F2AC|nr:universal stress protein [Blastococcus sp. CT_GayMR16]TFV87346.1 universal stress protein [Blastococcus sp. CT_GayMR16]